MNVNLYIWLYSEGTIKVRVNLKEFIRGEEINLSFLSIDMESARFYRWLQFHLGKKASIARSARIPQTRGSMWKNAEERSLIFVSNLLVRSWRSSGSREQWRSIVKEIAIKISWRVIEGLFHEGVVDIMLATGLCVFLVLALAGSVSTLLPEDFEDRTAPANLQEECASKCPDLDLNQVRITILWFIIYIYIYAETVYNSLLKRKNWNLKNSRFQILRRINVIETLSTWNISQLVSQIQWIRNNSIFFSILFPLFHIDQFLCRLFCTPRCNLLRFQHIVFARLERMFRKQKRKKK